MQLTIAALLAMIAGVPALPPSANQDLQQSLAHNNVATSSQGPCGPLMRKAVCCRKSVLDVINLGCKRAKPDIHTGPELTAACEAKGKVPKCCILGLVSNPSKGPPSYWLGGLESWKLRDSRSKLLTRSDLTAGHIRTLQASPSERRRGRDILRRPDVLRRPDG